MVRKYLINDKERKEIQAYLKTPDVMSPRLRQTRLTIKKIDFRQLEEDVKLLKKFKRLRTPIGRKSKELSARFKIERLQEKK